LMLTKYQMMNPFYMLQKLMGFSITLQKPDILLKEKKK